MKRWSFLAVPAVCLALAPVARGVRPAAWVHTTEAHFSTGKFDAAVANSLGEISLGRKIKILAASSSAPAVVSCVAAAGKTLYAGAGNEAVIYKVQGDKAVKFAELPSTMIGCLFWTGRELLAGTGGDKAGIYRVDGRGKHNALWADAKVKYVWAVLAGPDGGLYAATGPEAKVFAVDKNGKAQVVYHADKLAKNILCLAAGADGKLYAGTDEKGLVIEIDPKAKTGRVLFDAPEKEIAALVAGDDGTLFAATADAAKASADGAKTPATTKAGKADNGKKTPAKPKPKPPTTKPADKKPPAKPAEKPKPAPKPAEKPKPAPKPAEKPKPAPKPAEKPKDKPKEDKPKDKPKEDKPKDKPKEDKPKDKPKEPAKPEGKPKQTAKPDKPAEKRAAHPAAPGKDRKKLVPAASSAKPAAPGGARPAAPTPSGAVRIVRRTTTPSRPSPTTPPKRGAGNAVYVVGTDGLVQTLFRKPVTILAMLRSDGRLVLGTGNGGGIYTVSLDGDEVAMAADTDAKQVTCLAAGPGGQVVFATANKGSVGVLEKGFARKGTFVAKALDAKQIAQWGTMQVRGAAPAGTSVTIATRSGNVAEPDEKTWSSWSKEMPLEAGYLPIGTPAGRFLQYRLTLSSNGRAAPKVGGVQIVFQVGNLPPSVAGVMIQASPKGRNSNETAGGAMAWRHIAIRAADVNGDKLRFILQFRRAGTEPWITLTDLLAVPKFIWDTRSMADGVYELRVTATDDPTNPAAAALKAARISDPFTIDNTPPAVRNVAAKLAGTTASVTGLAEDASSRVASIHYAVDSQTKWVALLPGDGICDSNRERFAFDAKDLKPGAHRIAVRVADVLGNVGYGEVIVNVGK